MRKKLTLTYPAPIPVGHRIEVTFFEDTRSPKEQKKKFNTLTGSPDWNFPHARPVVRDLDTGIQYMHYKQAASGPTNFLAAWQPTDYSFEFNPDLPIASVHRGTVTHCSVVTIELSDQVHTMLGIDVEE